MSGSTFAATAAKSVGGQMTQATNLMRSSSNANNITERHRQASGSLAIRP